VPAVPSTAERRWRRHLTAGIWGTNRTWHLISNSSVSSYELTGVRFANDTAVGQWPNDHLVGGHRHGHLCVGSCCVSSNTERRIVGRSRVIHGKNFYIPERYYMTQTFDSVPQIQEFVTRRYLPISEGCIEPSQTTRPRSVRPFGKFWREDSEQNMFRIWGFHSGHCGDYGVPGCDAV
jgi:hypothetical protein